SSRRTRRSRPDRGPPSPDSSPRTQVLAAAGELPLPPPWRLSGARGAGAVTPARPLRREDPLERPLVSRERRGRARPVTGEVGAADLGVAPDRLVEGFGGGEPGVEQDAREHEPAQRSGIASDLRAHLLQLRDLTRDHARAFRGRESRRAVRIAGGDPELA